MCRNRVLWTLALCCGMWHAELPAQENKQTAAGLATGGADASGAVPGRDVVLLPAELDRVVVGGSGKYLIGCLPALKQVAILDVAAKKIVQFLPVDGDDVLVAAGETRLVVLNRSKGTIGRYKLGSWEREQEIACEAYKALAMGSSSEGPLVALGAAPVVIALDSLKVTPIDTTLQPRLIGDNVLAAGNGQVFGCWKSNSIPSGMTLLELIDGSFDSTYQHAEAGTVYPGPDGCVIYTDLGPCLRNSQPRPRNIPGPPSEFLLPAATGPFYLAVQLPVVNQTKSSKSSKRSKGVTSSNSPPRAEPARLTVHCRTDSTPLFTITDALLPVSETSSNARPSSRAPLHQHLFLLPIADALVTVPLSRDKFVIQRLNVLEELEKAGTDYCFVASAPPATVKPGEKMAYAIEVISKHKSLKYALDVGPQGMSISPQGLLTWEVPADVAATNVRAVVNITAGSGRRISHTINLNEPQSPGIRRGRLASAAPSSRPGSEPTSQPRPAPAALRQGVDAANGASGGRAREVVRLPAELDRTVMGASGKYLITFLPRLKQVAVLDVSAKKIAKLLPVEGADVLVAAGETKLVVLERSKGIITRYNLASWEREATTICEPYVAIAMGSSSEGPLVALGKKTAVLDLLTLQEIASDYNGALNSGENLQASANGEAFGCWRGSGSPTGMTVLQMLDGRLIRNYAHISVGGILPGPDGNVIYTSQGLYAANCQPLSETRVQSLQTLIPAATGPFYLGLHLNLSPLQRDAQPPSLTVHSRDDTESLFTANDVLLPAPTINHPMQAQRAGLHQHLFLLPIVDSLVTVPISRDRFVIQHFNVTEELDKAGKDYFFVTSTPPRAARPGQKLSYRVQVSSNRKELRYSLDAGLAGMAISPDGLLTWDVPADGTAANVAAIVRISNGSGREITHTIKLNVTAEDGTRRRNPQVAGADSALRTGGPAPAGVRATPAGSPFFSGVADAQQDPSAIINAGEAVPLPAPVTSTVVGASGKYLISFMPTARQVAVLDVSKKKIVKILPVDADDVRLAAGETRLVILDRAKGVISRYSLASYERELSLSCEHYEAIAMGSSSEGPVLALVPGATALDTRPTVLDLTTLRPADLSVDSGLRIAGDQLLAAANGRVFGCWGENYSPFGMTVMEIVGSRLRGTYAHTTAGAVQPSPDGHMIYTGVGLFSMNCKPFAPVVDTYATQVLLPAATGPYYLSLHIADIAGRKAPEGNYLDLHCQGGTSPLFTATNVDLPIPVGMIHPAGVCRLALHQHLFLLPAADALVTVPLSNDRFLIRHFNVLNEMDKANVDYFFVASSPPRAVQPGEKLVYRVEVVSKRKTPLQYFLETGPTGMAVSPNGVVTWQCPDGASPTDVLAIVKIADGNGREISQTFKLNEAETPLRTGNIFTFPSSPRPQSGLVPPPGAMPSPAGAPPLPKAATIPGPSPGPVAVPLPASMAVATPLIKVNENQWSWTGPAGLPVPSDKGRIGGLLVDQKLYLVDAVGAPQTEAVTLPSKYFYAGVRPDRVIGVAMNPTRVEILDRTGKLLRQVHLGTETLLGFALHPNKPICYVGLNRNIGELRGIFVAVDEEAGKFKEGEEQFGQALEVEPSGRFLVASFSHNLHVADQLVIVPGRSPGRPVAPNPGRPMPGRPGGGRHRPGIQPGPGAGGAQLGVRQTYANILLALVYDLEDPLQPGKHNMVPLTNMQPGQLRLSYDGRRLTSLILGSDLPVYDGCDPLNRKTPPVKYELAGGGAPRLDLGTDIAHHPLLPITVVAGNGRLTFLDSNDGHPLAGKETAEIPDSAGKRVRRVMFSSDGRQLAVLARGGANNNDHFLTRTRLPISTEEGAAMQQRRAAPPAGFAVRTLPLADITALGGGVAKPISAADIAANFSDAVVIVRCSTSTGTGFIIGKSGLILTCAHCVSLLEPMEVVYHPAGKSDEKKVIEATIVSRDAKRDLALLQISVEDPLHSVGLAPPLDVRSGEDVTIIANPGLGTEVLDNTVTTGIISNAKRTIEGLDYIQSSAAVNPGSSGGPMFDRNGRVVGVVVLKAVIDGVGFAVPAPSITQFLLKATRRDGEAGQIVRKWVDKSLTREFEGRLVGIDNGAVTLISGADGQSKTRPFTIFSEGDQKLLEMLPEDQKK